MFTHVMTSAETIRRIIENLNTAVLLCDEKLCLKYINPAAEMLFDISARQIQGQRVQELLSDSGHFMAALRRSIESGRPCTEHEIQLVLNNAQTITVDWTVVPLGETRREKELLVELVRVDRHLWIAREENLLAQYHSTRALVRGMAHEINNPLGGLRGAAQLLDRELPDTALKEYTRVIISEADRLQQLLARLTGPTALPHKCHVNIHEILEHVRLLVEAETPPEISIIRDYDPSIPDLYADPDHLIQAVLNIVRNAVQALEGVGQIVLRTRTQRQFTLGRKRYKGVVRIDIVDNGPGIPDGMLESIFYPMVTGRADGTGLGLSVAQSLVNQYGGLIECASRPGETVFTLYLPLENDDE